MSEETFEQSGRQTGPDESFRDRCLARVERMKIGVGLPLLEEKLDLPTQTVQGRDRGDVEVEAFEIRRMSRPALKLTTATFMFYAIFSLLSSVRPRFVHMASRAAAS